MTERQPIETPPTTELVDRLRDSRHCNDWYMRQEAADEIERLRAALTKCLHTINDYFGLSDGEVKQAIDEAISNPDGWTPHRK